MTRNVPQRRVPVLSRLAAALVFGVSAGMAVSAVPLPPTISELGSLKGVKPPPVPGLEQFVRNPTSLLLLGKALFWDMQAGSDGQACASCHFHAGADNRVKNQLSPGLLTVEPGVDPQQFDPTATGAGGPNYTLRKGDFPFRQLTDPTDRNSPPLFETDDVVSSQGVFRRDFVSLIPGSADEKCNNVADFFHVKGKNVRRVEPRNTPTTINAVFNFRNFWDGRANNIFNGVDPFGRRSDAQVVAFDPYTGISMETVALENSSAASQAVGPPLSPFEMSCDGRKFKQIGRKLLGLQPLAFQKVDKNDSVLGFFANAYGRGLSIDYKSLIKQAFNRRYWSSWSYVDADGFNQMEANFSLFWGLAIQAYENKLISDITRFDLFMDGNPWALTHQEQRGLVVFLDQGKCVNCHAGPEFTKAAFSHLGPENQEEGLVERMQMADLDVALYDNGFYNIGVTPTAQDIGLGGIDGVPGRGDPLSFTRQYIKMLLNEDVRDPFQVDPCKFEVRFTDPDPFDGPFPDGFVDVACDEGGDTVEPARTADNADAIRAIRVAVDGAFKVPGLRNVELTGPYMHNGGMKSLEEVVEFYNRGGNRVGPNAGPDSTGHDGTPSNLDPDIQPLGLTVDQQKDLVAFLKSLTDDRVRWELAPFDHPQLFVPNGHPGNENYVVPNYFDPKRAADDFIEIPAVGFMGRSAKGLPALKPFEAGLGY